MSKVKMRCITCGKWFQSANAKEVTCPDCTQKSRKDKLAAKNGPPATQRPGAQSKPTTSPAVRPVAPKPKHTQSGTSQWLDSLNDVKIAEPEQPVHPKPVPSSTPRENRGSGYRETETGRTDREQGGYRGTSTYRDDKGQGDQRGPGGYRMGNNSSVVGPRPRQPMERQGSQGLRPERQRPGSREGMHGGPRPKPKAKAPRPATPSKPKQPKTPPPPPFVPTPEQVTQVEQRYIELAVPSEFDGIRTQIAKELSIPKKAVKKIVKALREQQHIPSWWESQTYKGSPEELEKIKVAYLPLLPVPPVGVHKNIAEQLEMKPGVIYQAIKTIRLEMNLPQYNDPALHSNEEMPTAASSKEKSTPVSDEEKPTPESSKQEQSTGEQTQPESAQATPTPDEQVEVPAVAAENTHQAAE